MAARKSRLYLNAFIPVEKTHDEIVAEFFRSGRYTCTIAGSLQLVGILCLVANLSITIVSDYCHYHQCHRRLIIGSAMATFCNSAALYLVFACGYVVHNPALWVRISIVTNLTLAIVTIVAQALAMQICRTITTIHKSPGPIAVAGGVCLLISAAFLFILYRYKEIDDTPVEVATIPSVHDFELFERERERDRVAVEDSRSMRASREEAARPHCLLHCECPHHLLPHRKGIIFTKHEDLPRRSVSVVSRLESEGVAPRRKQGVCAIDHVSSRYSLPSEYNHHSPTIGTSFE